MSWSHPYDTWMLMIAVLCAVSCAMLGCFLVLRKASMMGDAISHAVLPGLAGGFLLAALLQSSPWLADHWPWLHSVFTHIDPRSPIIMLAGAVIVGVLTALLTEWLHGFGRVEHGAAMGVVFSTLFAIGLILIRKAADEVDLDPSCVLYGSIELAPSDVWNIVGYNIPRSVIILSGALILNVTFIGLCYKELKLTSFDPELAESLGISARLIHFMLMTIVAINTVAAFEIVGSILVIAMLIVPAAAAHLLTERLSLMLIISAILAILMAAIGHVGAIVVPGWFGFSGTIVAGSMATAAGVVFAIVLLIAPQHGMLSRAIRRWSNAQHILREDMFGILFRLEELDRETSVPEFFKHIKHGLHANWFASRIAYRQLKKRALLLEQHGSVQLTPLGRRRARQLVRSHRLWEAWLVRELGLRDDHVHRTAMQLEHITDRPMQDDLAREVEASRTGLDDTSTDPHGRDIPPPR